MAFLSTAVTVANLAPGIVNALSKLFGVMGDNKDKKQRAELDEAYNEFKKELQKDFEVLGRNFELLGENVSALEKKINRLTLAMYTLSASVGVCIAYIVLHIARIVR